MTHWYCHPEGFCMLDEGAFIVEHFGKRSREDKLFLPVDIRN